MPFRRQYISHIFFLSCIFICCREATRSEAYPVVEREKVKFLYYDSAFTLDSESNINLAGYYRVREAFGVSFKATYGFLQFFPDGFCKVGHWNGIYKSEAELDAAFNSNPAFTFWGVYKTVSDTLSIEYLYNPASAGQAPFENKFKLVGIIKDNEIVILETQSRKYSYPNNPRDSTVNSCIGKFVSHQSLYLPENNYLKANIRNYQ